MARRLELAGGPLSLDAMVGVGAATGVLMGCVCLLGVMMAPPAILLCPLGFVCGARGPSVALARRARRRQDRLARAVPGMVEVLMAATDAGLGPAVAFRRTAQVLGGPMGQELRLTAQEMDLGVAWDQALAGLARRTDVQSIRRMVAALTRSNRLGTSVGLSLRRVADDLRRERRTRAEEMARKAPIKMLFPLVFLILPAFLLLTVGPVLLATIRSLS
jgi:tight adherence protein C